MKRKSVVAILLLVAVVFAFAGCNYVSRPAGVANNAGDTSGNLANLLTRPQKNVITQDKEHITYKEPTPSGPSTGGLEDSNQPDTQPPSDEPTEEAPSSPFDFDSADVFDKIQTILQKVQSDLEQATSATGVSDALMSGRTVYVYTPYDITGQDEAIMRNIAGKLNMTVVLNNLKTEGANYSARMKQIYNSGVQADLMFVDQNTWGDIQYYTQPLTSFVNFELGDQLNTFRSSMSQNYTITDAFYPSEQLNCQYYVAAGIGAPHLLAYNKDALQSTGVLAAESSDMTYKEVKLDDPVQMYKDKTWGLKAMQQILAQSTVGKTVGLGTLRDFKTSTDWWFGCDNVPGFKLDIYTKAAELSAEGDGYSVAGGSTQTLDTIQELYWTTTGSNGMNVASFFEADEQDKAITKLLGTYSGHDGVTKYAMLGVTADQLPQIAQSAGNVKWDFVPYPYGTMTENKIRSQEPYEGVYFEENGVDPVGLYNAGWASGFAVMERCQNPGIALRVGEEFTVAWRENYEAPIQEALTDEQWARYEEIKSSLGITFYQSMQSHVQEMADANPGAISRLSSAAIGNMNEFTKAPDLFTQPIFNKNVDLASYSAATSPTWSSYFTVDRADGMAAAYEIARVMFNY